MVEFTEWLTQHNNADLIENQVSLWVDKLNGLMYNLSKEEKSKLIEKVITGLEQIKQS